jgi:Na+/proline symporter
VTTLSAGLFLVTRSLADGIRLFATSIVIAVVTGVPTAWSTLIVGLIMIVYTVRGGAAAVIWTDVVQMFIYAAGAGLVAVALLGHIPGGWDEVVRAGTAAGKFTFFDASTDPTAHTI